MYDLISSLLGILKVEPINTDNNIFRLHYKASTFILIVFSLLLTQKQYFGDPIDCLSDSDIDTLDTYCWIQSTFTLPEIRDRGAYPGVYNPHPGLPNDEPVEVKHHSYYQWVTLFLYFQALMFYLPCYLWKIWEGERLKMLIEGLHLPVLEEENSSNKKMFLATYLKLNWNKQDGYAFKFFICEVLNFINVVFQIHLTNVFVGYEFSTYGLKVLNETQNTFYSRTDALEYVFPKVAKCTYINYGPSGTQQKIDALCVLPLNVFNEKLYIFLWFWFIFVAFASGVGIIYRIGTFFEYFREKILHMKGRLALPNDLSSIARKAKIGDWFIIYQIAKNMDESTFKSFISKFAQEI